MKPKIAVFALLLTLPAVLLCGAGRGGSAPAPRSFPPSWEKGDWWITETHVLLDFSKRNSGPLVLGDFLFHHKWTVEGKETVNRAECWVIDVRAHNLPATVRNDHGDAHLVRLYLDSESRVLRGVDFNFRQGMYGVTGKKVSEYTKRFDKGNPVILDWCQISCPLDVPRLPKSWLTQGLVKESKEQKYKDERSGRETTQHVQPFAQIRGKARTPSMFVVLTDRTEKPRTQLWVAGCPWWSEWRCSSNKGVRTDLWLSRTIDWKGKRKRKQ